MNSNRIGTISSIVGILVLLVTNVFGCTTDATGDAVCKATFASPLMLGLAAACLMGLNLLVKIFSPGGVLAGLWNKTAVVVPDDKGKTGVVTVSQLASFK